MKERCRECGRPLVAHMQGKCPPLDVHVVIDVDTVERAQKTGHPRLLKNLLSGHPTGLFAGVTIKALSLPHDPRHV